MLYSFKNGQTSVVLRAKLLDSSSTTGAGLTGLTSASSGLIISTIADNEASATAYTVAGSTIESITTLGTFAAPTATKCRFKELDSTNHKGIYEFQFADARFAVSSAKSLLISVAGATNLQQADFVVVLKSDDPFVAKPANFASLSIDGSGRVDIIKINGTSQTARDIGASVLLAAGQKVDVDTIKTNPVVNGGTITFPTNATLASTTNITAGTITTTTNLTTNNDKTGYALTAAYDPAKTASQAGDAMTLTSGERNSTADALLDRAAGVETGQTFRQAMRLMLAALCGKASGLATTTAVYRDTNDAKNRISATVDADGNRSAVTLDAS